MSNKNQAKGSGNYIDSKQILEIEIAKGKIAREKVISLQTIIQASNIPLPIILNIPQVALTGTKYDFDIIVEKPLGNSILAGGLTAVTPEQIQGNISPNIHLSQLGGGGLFKSVKAPLKPGMQHWAAVIAHPEGIIKVTKTVKIVSNKSEIISNNSIQGNKVTLLGLSMANIK